MLLGSRRPCGFRWGRGSCGPIPPAVAALALVQAALGDWTGSDL